MEYLLTFLEGLASFISPCLLPMLPIYISYFMGEEETAKKKAIINSIGFVLGFTIVFLILSIFASTIGYFISSYTKYIKIAFGIIIIILGFNYMDILKRALDVGYQSVMVDGSRLPLEENIATTAEVSAFAKSS